MSNKPNILAGALNIDKPAGITSHDVVAHVRRLLTTRPQARLAAAANFKLQTRVGHAGTLDPFATGVLLILIGPATRLMEYVNQLPKTYQTTIILGAVSDTDDLTGIITTSPRAKKPSATAVTDALKKFTGTIKQTPPIYSAVKVQGKKLYQYARAGQTATALAKAGDRPRSITIHGINLVDYRYPEMCLSVTCSSGTYIRALARDIGEHLGTSAYTAKLHRTKIGNFDIRQAIQFNKLTADNLPRYLQSPRTLIEHLPAITLPPTNVAQLRSGQPMEWSNEQNKDDQSDTDKPIALFDNNNSLIGIGRYDTSTSLLRPTKIL